MVLWSVCFFFSSRRRHTRCGRDWSSDVCSSDLGIGTLSHMAFASIGGYTSGLLTQWLRVPISFGMLAGGIVCCAEIGRASCRGRVEISVVAVSLKKKKKEVGALRSLKTQRASGI